MCKARFGELPDIDKMLCIAFADGINFYLKTHPNIKPRLLTTVDPWMVWAHRLQIGLDWMFGKAHINKHATSNSFLRINLPRMGGRLARPKLKTVPRCCSSIRISPGLVQEVGTRGTSKAMKDGISRGLDFRESLSVFRTQRTSGLGTYRQWPDVADAYRLTFDDPADPLKYRSNGSYRQATKRQEIIKVKTEKGIEERKYEFTDTHLGPIVDKEDDTHFIAVRIANLDKLGAFTQGYRMTKAKSWEEWRPALDELQLAMFNCIYADKDGNIAYIYNGAVPARDPSFEWDKPVDGSNPKTEWQGYHSIAELPQCINPATGYVQNCNQSPFFTTDDFNPIPQNFPEYMVEDKTAETRLPHMLRMPLRKMHQVTLDDWVRGRGGCHRVLGHDGDARTQVRIRETREG